MSMNQFSVVGEEQLESGFIRLKFAPFYNPTVLIYDRCEAENIGSEKLGENEPKKGVYVLAETTSRYSKYNVTVGLSGVDRKRGTAKDEQQSLLRRVKHHASNPPSFMKGWDKAILICDWENDIRNRAMEFGHVTQKNQNAKIDEAMKSEVHLIEKMLHTELMKFNEKSGSLKVHRNADPKRFQYYMPTPDNERYQYYIKIVLEALREIDINYKKDPEES